MATNLLWFVLAGFLLGFASSTLWEWFYFRKERMKLTDRRIRELEAKLREAESNSDIPESTENEARIPVPTVAALAGGASPRTSAWGEPAYRSPGVFLESEEIEAEDSEPDVPRRERAHLSVDSAPANFQPTVPPHVLPNVPTVNSISPPPAGNLPPNADGTNAIRADAPTPADALRAKRSAGPRSRQEVLAALRRNSEAMQRGEFPPPEGDVEANEVFAPRPSPFVNALPPQAQSTPVEAQPTATPQSAPASPARQRWVNDAALTARTTEYPDDLSKIKGIGDVYKQRLYRAGIYTWKQIAETDVETLRRAVSANQSANIAAWYEQAEALMDKHARRNAIYSGPQPDDMTKILGIGPVGAAVLYRAGICTYEQLASTSLADLEKLFPLAVAGDQPDFALWIERAAKLADEKHS